MDELIGRRILSVAIDAGRQHYLRIRTDAGEITYVAEGDCCSESWFAHIGGVDALIGGTVAAVEYVEMGDVEDGRSRQEHDVLYGVKITTDRGHADVEFRNSSNGYYGGHLAVWDDDNQPTNTDPNDDRIYIPVCWSDVVEDWSA